MNTDFLIVGGGIGGLVLAELLGRAGKRVVVLERSTGPPPWNRPEILWPATQRLLLSLVPREAWEAEAIVPLGGLQLFDGQAFQAVATPEIFDQAGVHPWSTNPNLSRELLMRLQGFELRRGVEVKEVLHEGGRVVGVRAQELATDSDQQFLAEWTVGDDGVHSLVRQAIGIDLQTRLLPLDLLAFQCDWPAAFEHNIGRLWPNRRDPRSGILGLGILPAPGAKGVGVAPVRGRAFDDLPRAQRAWQEFLATEPHLCDLLGSRRFPEDYQRVKRPWGHAPRYGGPGALLMGDAAHPVSPAGGQGANMSIADGRVIAELVLAGERDLVAAYERKRRPANQRSLRFTRTASFALGLPDWLVFNRATAWAARQAGRPSLVVRLLRTVSTAFLER